MGHPSAEDIFRVSGAVGFNRLALETFRFQAAHCPVYREYVTLLGIEPGKVRSVFSIPFMPVSFFRDHEVITRGDDEPLPGTVPAGMAASVIKSGKGVVPSDTVNGRAASGSDVAGRVFLSSGTTGMRQSRHYVKDTGIYDESLERTFRLFYGDPSGYAVMGLLPSYLEREGSSLIYMVNRLIQLSGNDTGGFFLDDYDALFGAIERARAAGLKVLLTGVTFALLDLAENHPRDLSDVIIMETGGMKGRRKEMIREEVHEILMKTFGVSSVHSEYGMTELLSQAYSKGSGLFMTPPWMKVLIRDSHDPMAHTDAEGSTGGISIIDLANLWSCSFIATDDLGRMHPGGMFEVQGRFDEADIRGCNLLVS
jgi:phenylacetate-coenzyme A ligase PaaK-like adenylate-forming protein